MQEQALGIIECGHHTNRFSTQRLPVWERKKIDLTAEQMPNYVFYSPDFLYSLSLVDSSVEPPSERTAHPSHEILLVLWPGFGGRTFRVPEEAPFQRSQSFQDLSMIASRPHPRSRRAGIAANKIKFMYESQPLYRACDLASPRHLNSTKAGTSLFRTCGVGSLADTGSGSGGGASTILVRARIAASGASRHTKPPRSVPDGLLCLCWLDHC